MKTAKKSPNTIEEYIATFPADEQVRLKKIREAIRKAAPDAEEKIGYGIPTFTLNGNLVHFGGFKNHVGFYPDPSGIKQFEKELSPYVGAKGSVQFPHDKPLPLALITKIVKYRVKENIEKGKKESK